MAEFIEFTNNYQDLSTDRGFQWEFRCERCDNGYRSKFRASATGTIAEVLEGASSIFGGVLNTLSNVADRVHSPAWERAHDDNFAEAAQEIRPMFVQCPRCNNWVCRQRCWNEKRGLCFNCAPDTTVETSAAQAGAITDQAVEAVRARTYDVKDYTAGDELRAACPNCGAALKVGAKFCGECGTPIKQNRFCTECGSAVEANAKFCPSCGAKQQ